MIMNENRTIIVKNDNGMIDLIKFILSIMVVAIHTELYPEYLFPWLRVAVPLFFMITSYFFFNKIDKFDDEYEKVESLKKFVKRNLKLYLFWFICLLPFTLIIRRYFSNGFLRGILLILKGFLFSSTFPASWFLMASIIATIIVFFTTKKFGNNTMFFIFLIVNILVCLRSSYYPLLKVSDITENFLNCYESIFSNPVNSFPVALFWVMCGKVFAEKKLTIKRKYIEFLLLLITGVGLWLEWYFVEKYTSAMRNDSYIMLMPFCCVLFLSLYNKNLNFQYSKILRSLSTITYVIHYTFILGFKFCIGRLNIEINNLTIFIITLCVCWGIGLFILFFKDKKYFKWLRFTI